MLHPYREILAIPGARAFVAWGLTARIQMGITGLATFLFVQIEYGSYEAGGVVLAAIALSYAAIAPQVARIVDSHGQSRVLRWGFAIAITGRLLMIAAVLTGQPLWVLVLIAPTFAAVGSQSTLTRARWVHVVRDRDQLSTAFSLESVLEEVLFIMGPALATVMATQLSSWSPSVLAVVTQAVGGYVFLTLRDTEPPVRQKSSDSGLTEAALSVAPTTAAAGIALPHVTAASAKRRRRYRNPFGTHLLVTTPVLILVMLVFMTQGVLFASVDASTVAFAEELGHKHWSGGVLAVWAFGSLVGGLLYGSRRWRKTLATRFLIAISIVGLGVTTFMITPTLAWLGLAMFITGMAIAPAMAIGDAVVHAVVPNSRMTEGLTWTRFGLDIGIAAGAWSAGALIDRVGSGGGFGVTTAAGILGIVVVVTSWKYIRSTPDVSGLRDQVTTASSHDTAAAGARP